MCLYVAASSLHVLGSYPPDLLWERHGYGGCTAGLPVLDNWANLLARGHSQRAAKGAGSVLTNFTEHAGGLGAAAKASLLGARQELLATLSCSPSTEAQLRLQKRFPLCLSDMGSQESAAYTCWPSYPIQMQICLTWSCSSKLGTGIGMPGMPGAGGTLASGVSVLNLFLVRAGVACLCTALWLLLFYCSAICFHLWHFSPGPEALNASPGKREAFTCAGS